MAWKVFLGQFITVIAVTVIPLVVILLPPGISCTKDDDNSGIPTNPCAAVLCIVNTTCIAIPDVENCHPAPYTDSCPKTAMCVPNGIQLQHGGTPGMYCGINGEQCQPGYKCGFVYPFCPALMDHPCYPILACVPITHIP